MARHTPVLRTASPAKKWWQWADLNRRPKAYESSALPLSYTANASVYKELKLAAIASMSTRRELQLLAGRQQPRFKRHFRQ